jgi:hypothetical protein
MWRGGNHVDDELKERARIEQAIRDLQLYIDVKWGGRNDMLNLALTALREKAERKLKDTITKALRRHIKTLQKRNNSWQKRYYKLQAENEQLRAQVARMREALAIANNYMPDVGHFCACGPCKTCGANINYASYGHCLKCARNIIDAALSDKSSDYHNPADVAALRKAKAAIKAAWSDGSVNAALGKASEALAEIGKALGGREDV